MELITDLNPHPVHHYDTLFVVVCRFSKFVTLIPTQKNLSGAGTIDLLQQHVFATFRGCPISIVSDRDPRWTGTAFSDFCKSFNIKHLLSSAAHPQIDGLTERLNRSIEEIACNYLGYDQSLFWDILPEITFAINDTPIRALNDSSPFTIGMGQSPLRPLNVSVGLAEAAPPSIRDRILNVETVRTEIRELLLHEAAIKNTV